MNDLISRQAAIDALCKAECGSGYCGVSCDDVKAIEQLPPAQPQPEEDCDTCKHGYFGDSQCNNCRVRFPSHYEREEGQHGSD